MHGIGQTQASLTERNATRSAFIRPTVVVQSLSCVRFFATPWTTVLQASLSFTISQRLLKLTSIESMVPFNHLILLVPFLLLPSIFPASRSFPMSHLFTSDAQSTGASNEYSGLISFRIDCFDLLAVQGTLKSLLQHTAGKHQFFGTQPSYSPTLKSVHDYWKSHSFD